MRVHAKFAALAVLAVALVATPLSPAGAANSHASSRAVCPSPLKGRARCHSLLVTDGRGNPLATTLPGGYGPAQFHGAYALPATTSASSSQTIAIVDAFDDPTVKKDLDTYDSTFGLSPFPSCSSTITTSCFQKVNQDGVSGSFPRKDQGWALEISLDVQIAHAICQDCKILLVEATSNSFANLGAAVNTAAKLGANVISNSYGGSDSSPMSAYKHPGIAITASSGDGGYGVESPASFNTVVAVGGTTLNINADNSYKSETVWSGSGSGCSTLNTAKSWQTSTSTWGQTGCGTERGVADVAADADPATGAAVYDSTRYHGITGWFQVGGTSLSSPLIAAVYALAGNAGSASYPASIPYANTASLHDVTSGSNGSCSTIMCKGVTGYDGPTGVGTPKGTGGF
ncbi:MAG: peptidase S8 [Actinobacteria bacterium]|nr:peptidase S8 [Actinomycetota bacterium]